jgi:Fe-S-cluster-containing dehydrogenase component
MNLQRRDFFKVLSAGVAVATSSREVQARDTYTNPPDAVGLLYDATLCIGCKACEVGCKTRNKKPAFHSEIEEHFGVQGTWDAARDLNSSTLNKIKVYKNGTAAVKDREIDGFSFVKRACMHCADPDCQSACPTSALQKDPVKGYVTWDKDACCGCRYCQVACQYLIPKFQYDKALPELVKCELCHHVLEEGGITGCAEWCPTGATIYGRLDALMKEAKQRLELKSGEIYNFPVRTVDSKEKKSRPVANYVKQIYGEKEGGGAQYLLLSAVPFSKLGLPTMPETSGAAKSETLQHTLYKGLIGPLVLLGGLAVAAYRSTKKHPTDE